MMKLIIHTDGGARGNPGEAAIGVVIKNESGRILTQLSRRIGQTTNNVAEYTAVVEALIWIKNNPINTNTTNNPIIINFYLDSKLVVNQLNGLFKMKDAKLRTFLFKARQLEQEIGLPIYYSFVPREKNWEADRLVNQALDSQY